MAHELDNYWFASKRSGCGSGLPIAWQGWAVSALYAAVVAAAAFLLPQRSVVAAAAIITGATVAFLIACARKTQGGWHWRWGGACTSRERSRSDTRRQLLLALAAAAAIVAGTLVSTLI